MLSSSTNSPPPPSSLRKKGAVPMPNSGTRQLSARRPSSLRRSTSRTRPSSSEKSTSRGRPSSFTRTPNSHARSSLGKRPVAVGPSSAAQPSSLRHGNRATPISSTVPSSSPKPPTRTRSSSLRRKSTAPNSPTRSSLRSRSGRRTRARGRIAAAAAPTTKGTVRESSATMRRHCAADNHERITDAAVAAVADIERKIRKAHAARDLARWVERRTRVQALTCTRAKRKPKLHRPPPRSCAVDRRRSSTRMMRLALTAGLVAIAFILGYNFEKLSLSNQEQEVKVSNSEKTVALGPEAPPPLTYYSYECNAFLAFQKDQMRKTSECKVRKSAAVRGVIELCLDTASKIFACYDSMNDSYEKEWILSTRHLPAVYKKLLVHDELEPSDETSPEPVCERVARELHMENTRGETCAEFGQREYDQYRGILEQLRSVLSVCRHHELNFEMERETAARCDRRLGRSTLSREQARECIDRCPTMSCTERYRELAQCEDTFCWRTCDEEDERELSMGFYRQCIQQHVRAQDPTSSENESSIIGSELLNGSPSAWMGVPHQSSFISHNNSVMLQSIPCV